MPDESNHLPPHQKPRFTDETLSMVSNPKLDQILDRYLDDLQNGRACSREELLGQHPDLADELAEYLDGIEMVSGLGGGKDRVPQTLGDFEMIRPIGRGAMGEVYLANQISLKRPVALKILRYSVTGKQATARFEREAELVATLQHTNIVPIYATGKHDDLNYIAMQLIDGPSLSQWSAEEDADRDPITLAKWAAEVARALAHAHQRDVIHRDVKPSNLLQDEDQKIWLTDFGLARRFDDLRMSMTGAMLGTPNYMSPEQASPSRHPIDHRTDIYSLGATLFELLTGRCVFLAETPHAVLAQVLTEEPPQLGELLPDASRDLETILMKCLEKEPSDRYQTAGQLADDLEAFAAGLPIKARRPSVIEQAVRWKRHNQKAVSWAITAAATALTVLAISAASWIGWTNSQLGTLKITSDEGPIIGRLINADGDVTPTFTIPTQQPMPVKEGRYTLQMWAGGKLGESQELFVDHGVKTTASVKLSDEGVFDDRTVQGIPAVLPLDGRDDLVFIHDTGITRVDGRTGRDLWTAEENEFVKAINTVQEEKRQKQRKKKSKGRIFQRSIRWRVNGNRSRYEDRKLPVVAHGFPDINQDGEREVLIASHDQPVMFAFDGMTGHLHWHYVAVLQHLHYNAGSIHRPIDIGDIDNDGVHDFATTFFSEGGKFSQWIDAVSGKTGQRIWRLELPEKWFDKKQQTVSQFCEMVPNFGPQSRHQDSQRNYRGGVTFRNSSSAYVVPWPSILIPSEKETDANSLLLVCGTKLVICDAKTGEATDFNDGQPVELGFIPALTPKLVRSSDDKESPIGVLLTEQVAIFNPNFNKVTKPVTRFTMWSLETGKEIWRFDAASDLGWTGVMPDWPLVKDLNGDGVPEILIADGADLEKSVYRRATCLASLQALDARTGIPIWNSDDVARIRNQDRQVQRVLVGPDADGDRRDDVYVVSPMTTAERQNWIFIDILSAADGKLIRSTKSKSPVFDGSSNIDLEPPFFLGVGADGYPRLVVATMRVESNSDRQSTLLLSTGTGEMTHIGDQLEHPLQADGDGDGDLDLFLVKPRSVGGLFGTAQLVSLKSYGGRENKINAREYLPTDDVDGDGVRDLVTYSQSGEFWHALSGASGKGLWQWEYQTRGNSERIFQLNKDIDGDDVDDYALAGRVSFRRMLALTLVSGRGGRMLWQTQLPTDGFGGNSEVKCHDMDGDGVDDLVLIHRFNGSQRNGNDLSIRVSCFDGSSGTVRWHSELAAEDSRASGPGFVLSEYPLQIVDADNDGSPDVFCRNYVSDGSVKVTALSGLTGDKIWSRNVADDLKHTVKFRLWRAKLLATGPDQQKQFVTAANHGDLRKSERTVKLTFFDPPINKAKQSTFSWTGEGRFANYQDFESDPPGPWNGIPFEITAGEKRYTGVCVQGKDIDQDKEILQIVVLDSSQGKAIEVHRIDVPLPDGIRSGNACAGQFQIADVNQDGRTDIIFHDGSDLVATDLISKKEVNRKPMLFQHRHLSKVDPKTSLIHMLTNTNKYITTDTNSNQNLRLKLIDLKTFDMVWDVHMPSDGGNIFKGLLSGKQPDKSNVFSAIPRLLYKTRAGSMRSTATAAEYVGQDESLKEQISLAAPDPVNFDANRFDDPRMSEPLPWAGIKSPDSWIPDLSQIATNILLIVVGAILFPFFYIRFMLSKKSWSLQHFMLLPLIFVIPYLVLQLPLEVDGNSLARHSALQFGVSLWIGKLWVAGLAVPVLVFVAVWIKNLWNGNWRHLIGMSSVVIVIAIALGAMMLLANNREFPEGSHYDWYDWSSIMLFVYGMWFVGFLVISKSLLASIGRFLMRSARWISRRPKLATS